jgi:pyruvate dehydrogenase E1 component alpha subunit
MAARWRLPIVYVIENNRARPGTEHLGVPLAERGAAFGIPGEQVDGMCVRSVREAGERAIFRAREGGGPTVLEMRTERFRGHSMADPGKYRRKGEERPGLAPDPLDRLREEILTLGVAGEAELKAIDASVRTLVAEAADFAVKSPKPDPGELDTDVLL